MKHVRGVAIKRLRDFRMLRSVTDRRRTDTYKFVGSGRPAESSASTGRVTGGRSREGARRGERGT